MPIQYCYSVVINLSNWSYLTCPFTDQPSPFNNYSLFYHAARNIFFQFSEIGLFCLFETILWDSISYKKQKWKGALRRMNNWGKATHKWATSTSQQTTESAKNLSHLQSRSKWDWRKHKRNHDCLPGEKWCVQN